MTKFKSTPFRIERVEVEKETANSVYIAGRRYNKSSDYHSFHDTFLAAQAHEAKKAAENVSAAKRKVEYREEELRKILAWREA